MDAIAIALCGLIIIITVLGLCVVFSLADIAKAISERAK